MYDNMIVIWEYGEVGNINKEHRRKPKDILFDLTAAEFIRAACEPIYSTEKSFAGTPVNEMLKRSGVEGDLLTSRPCHSDYVLQLAT